ncbi:MAG TPA: hypothetical protein VE220_08805 [Gaiellaceae bacterium]|nr:hypothetical protein [Gaiellaceae bacterium]
MAIDESFVIGTAAVAGFVLGSPGNVQRHGAIIASTPAWRHPACPRMTGAMAADETQIPLDEQLGEIGAQLDWVRGYL